MKLSKAPTQQRKPFVDLPAQKLYIAATANAKNQITGFEVKYKGNDKTFEVKNCDIEKAWKELENFILKHTRR